MTIQSEINWRNIKVNIRAIGLPVVDKPPPAADSLPAAEEPTFQIKIPNITAFSLSSRNSTNRDSPLKWALWFKMKQNRKVLQMRKLIKKISPNTWTYKMRWEIKRAIETKKTTKEWIKKRAHKRKAKSRNRKIMCKMGERKKTRAAGKLLSKVGSGWHRVGNNCWQRTLAETSRYRLFYSSRPLCTSLRTFWSFPNFANFSKTKFTSKNISRKWNASWHGNRTSIYSKHSKFLIKRIAAI